MLLFFQTSSIPLFSKKIIIYLVQLVIISVGSETTGCPQGSQIVSFKELKNKLTKKKKNAVTT